MHSQKLGGFFKKEHFSTSTSAYSAVLLLDDFFWGLSFDFFGL